jgi:Spy/CpxP family protein refolding chaperone
MDETQRKAITLRGNLDNARLDLRKEMTATTPNKTRIDSAVDQIARAQADLQKSHLDCRQRSLDVLTADQKKKLDTLRLQRFQNGVKPGVPGLGPGRGTGMGWRQLNGTCPWIAPAPDDDGDAS